MLPCPAPPSLVDCLFLETELGARKVGVCALCRSSGGGGEEGLGGLNEGVVEFRKTSFGGAPAGGGGMDSFGCRVLLGETGIGGGTKLSPPMEAFVCVDDRLLTMEAEEARGCIPALSR